MVNATTIPVEMRKRMQYADDIAVLFYKDQCIGRDPFETFDDTWAYSGYYDVQQLLDDMTAKGTSDILDEEDKRSDFIDIWDNLVFDQNTMSYKYGNWELIILDI